MPSSPPGTIPFRLFRWIIPMNKLNDPIKLFNILRFPINILPMVSIMVITLRVAHDRIVNFMYSDELDRSNLTQGRIYYT